MILNSCIVSVVWLLILFWPAVTILFVRSDAISAVVAVLAHSNHTATIQSDHKTEVSVKMLLNETVLNLKSFVNGVQLTEMWSVPEVMRLLLSDCK